MQLFCNTNATHSKREKRTSLDCIKCLSFSYPIINCISFNFILIHFPFPHHYNQKWTTNVHSLLLCSVFHGMDSMHTCKTQCPSSVIRTANTSFVLTNIKNLQHFFFQSSIIISFRFHFCFISLLIKLLLKWTMKTCSVKQVCNKDGMYSFYHHPL